MTWLRKLWARWFCDHLWSGEVCKLRDFDICPGYKCKGCPLRGDKMKQCLQCKHSHPYADYLCKQFTWEDEYGDDDQDCPDYEPRTQ